ncbi:hypothetical protein [Nocardia mexicana]|uniref:Activator of Hsp90 ATPase-like protein n=1 Tax=Nocardia mexicana TaxID=279262 RepID=A0A370GKZ9_9NOCA|nr:hypothetical protein [Nocardia mexicana]RDI44448.1 hypothetical protein DFR68_11765 [Nocardia mexicana]
MNIADEINRVIRKITTSGEAHQVVLERAFDTDAADLWNACTSPERLSRWFEPLQRVSGGKSRCEPCRCISPTMLDTPR